MFLFKNSESASNQGDGRRNRVVALAKIILLILGLAAVVFVRIHPLANNASLINPIEVTAR